jgi:hypothetical protein
MRQFLKKYKKVLIGLLIVVIVTSAFIFVRRSNAGTANQFQTATIERGNLTTTIGSTGTVRAKQTAVLIWQAAGTVESVNVQVGDMSVQMMYWLRWQKHPFLKALSWRRLIWLTRKKNWVTWLVQILPVLKQRSI